MILRNRSVFQRHLSACNTYACCAVRLILRDFCVLHKDIFFVSSYLKHIQSAAIAFAPIAQNTYRLSSRVRRTDYRIRVAQMNRNTTTARLNVRYCVITNTLVVRYFTAIYHNTLLRIYTAAHCSFIIRDLAVLNACTSAQRNTTAYIGCILRDRALFNDNIGFTRCIDSTAEPFSNERGILIDCRISRNFTCFQSDIHIRINVNTATITRNKIISCHIIGDTVVFQINFCIPADINARTI